MKWNFSKVRVNQEYGDKQVSIFVTKMPDPIGQFAMAIIERFAIVAATPNGEDSAGRQALDLQPPVDLVKRAFDIAELAYEECNARGHLLDLPDLNEVNAANDAKRAAKETA